MISELAERDLRFGELVRQSCEMFKKQCLKIILIMIIIGIIWMISLIPLGLIAMMYSSTFQAFWATQLNISSLFLFLVGFLFAIMANLSLLFMLNTSIVLIVENAVKEQTITWTQILRQAFARLPAGIWTSFLAMSPGVILFPLLILLNFFIHGVILLMFPIFIVWFIYYIFAINAVALRGVSGKKAFAYARSLFNVYWWRTICFILPFIIMYVLMGSFFAMTFFSNIDHTALFNNPGSPPELPMSAELMGLAMQLCGWLSCIFIAIFIVLLFLNFDYRLYHSSNLANDTE